MFGIQFYPTPESLVDKMINKVDWNNVTSILEPSAGKGDILAGIQRYNDYFEFYYTFRVFDNITKKWRNNVMSNPQVYLGGNQMLQLMG